MSLSIKKIERMKPGERKSDGNNLYLQVNEAGAKSWLFRYVLRGRERWMGLGPLHTYNLAEARELARLARQQLKEGVDPIEARREKHAALASQQGKALTFRDAAKEFNQLHERKWTNPKSRAQFLSSLERYVFPVIGNTPVAMVDTPAVLRCIQPHWTRIPETMSRVRGRIESVLGWATASKHRPPGNNPATWSKNLAEVLPARSEVAKVRHHPALPFIAMPEFMADLVKREGSAAKALQFLILTAARTGEVIGARWDEIDLAKRVWTIPAERMKAGKIHRVPLSNQAVAVLAKLERDPSNPFVFAGTKYGAGLSNMSMAVLLQKRMGRPDATVHGMRSCFRDWCAETTDHANIVVEMALAHTIDDETEAAYRRGDLLLKRVRLMADWGRYCTSPVTKRGVLLPMRSKA